MSGSRKSEGASFEAAFLKVLGPKALDDLKKLFTDDPVVLIAGDQATGKSTASASIADELGGVASGTGRIVRAAAAKANMQVQDFVKTITGEMDIKLDYDACSVIAKGDAAAFESRLAGHLGQFLKKLGRQNVLTVYLSASPKERALRFVNREVSPQARTQVEQLLGGKKNVSFAETLKALEALNDPKADAVLANLKGIAARDEVDRTRLMGLYGVDYTDRSAFDVVIDTDGKGPDEVNAEVMAIVKKKLSLDE